MKINKPELFNKNNETVYSVKVELSDTTETLWYSIDEKYTDLVSDRADAALLALLIPAMSRAEDIYIDSDLSEKLYYNLSGRYQFVLKSIIPTLHIVKIYPTSIKSAEEQASGVATGFSAGIDSFSVLADHYFSPVSPNYKVTHLLYNNVGSHGSEGKGEILFKKRYNALKEHAEKMGLPLIYVNSNLNSFYKGFSFKQTHTPRNASVALLLQRGIGKYLYASAFAYKDIHAGKSDAMGYSDAITLPLMSTEVLDAFSVGSEYSRVEKTLQVAELPDSYNILDVCVHPPAKGNCSKCWKCRRTILTLEIAGLIDNYKNVFDLRAYRQGKTREKFIAHLIMSKDTLLQEIATYAKQRDYIFPLYSRLLAKSGLLSIIKKFK